MDATDDRVAKAQGGKPVSIVEVEESMASGSQGVRNEFAACFSSVADGYERWAATYDCAPNPLLAREERYLLSLLPDVRNKRTLDLACGTGRWLEKLTTLGSSVAIGIDCSGGMLQVASRKPSIAGRLTRGNCERLPIATSTFDLALCSFAIAHIADLEVFAREVSRACKPGAELFITDLHPDAYAQGWRVGFRDDQTAFQIEVFPRQLDDMLFAFKVSGFDCVSRTSLWLEKPERRLFHRAGKSDWFEAASRVPAVLVLHLRRQGSN
jgi:ubiquinone/menaquinone biosynthesis C-methylase UbiE